MNHFDINRLAGRVRSLWQAWRRSPQFDAEMHDEMRFHIDMEAERLVRDAGLTPDEARRRAFVSFGGVEKYKQEGRETRALHWVDAISLDARLGVRMLLKYRGLTLIGGFAMAVAIAIGATFFEVITELIDPALPFDGGDRVVALQYASTDGAERRVLHDFVTWRDELESIEQLGAFRTAQHNLVSGSARPEPVKVAEITASAFVVARTPPLAGRHLLPDDEREGATPVVVVGYQAWQSRFAGDPQIVGRTIALGGVPSTVVGVMPDGFRFPVDDQFWIPLRANPLAFERLQGPAIYMFGRLKAGVTIEQAQAELTLIGRRAEAAYPATHARLRPLVLPYTREHVDLTDPGLVSLLRMFQLVVGALVFVVAINLAILVYARTVTRLGEIAVRTALGAGRRRILAQLFIEAFALAGVGAATGLVLARIALARIQSMALAFGGVPFWIDLDISVATVMYAIGLAALAAVIIGVLPGLNATGERINVNLRELDGRSATRLGPLWTTLVVAQVAIAVAVLPVAFYLAWQVVQSEVAGPGFADEQFVVGTVVLSDAPSSIDADSIRRRQLELMSRLEAEPGVSAVTFSTYVPGMTGGRRIQFEDRTIPLGAAGSVGAGTLDVAVGMFEVYGAQMLAGRAFTAGDLGAANVVVVNETFEQTFLQNRAAVGLRFRYSAAPAQQPIARPLQQSYEIVGVVRDFPRFPAALAVDDTAVVYHPAAPGDVYPVALSIRFNGDIPTGFIERFGRIGAEVDPAMQLHRVMPLSEFYYQLRSLWRYVAWALGLVTTSVLLLSAAGIYALMSFTIAQRTREIGIRVALGAHPRRLLASVFGRVLRQLVLGVLIGSFVSGVLSSSTGFGLGGVSTLLLAVAATMFAVGLIAAFGPARRSLRIQAIDALRAD